MKSFLKPDIDDDWVMKVMKKGMFYRCILMISAFGLLLGPINMMWTLSHSTGIPHPDHKAPLGKIYHIILGEAQTVYISSFGGVVHKYDLQGRFVYQAPVPRMKGVYTIENGSNAELHITSRIKKYVIDSSGRMVQVLDIPVSARKGMSYDKNMLFRSEEGHLYLVKKNWFTSRTRVIRITNESDSEGETFIMDPAYFAVLQFTPVSILIVMLSCLTLYFLKENTQPHTRPNPLKRIRSANHLFWRKVRRG